MPLLASRPAVSRAGRLIRAGAVQDHIAVARNLLIPDFNLVGTDAECAGNEARLGKQIERVANVNDADGCGGIDAALQFRGRDERELRPSAK